MVKSEHLSDKEKLLIVQEELGKFKKAVKGHEKILRAIGEL